MKFVYIMMIVLLTGCGNVVKDCDSSASISILERLSVELFTGFEGSEQLYAMYDVDINNIRTISHTDEPEKYECSAVVQLSPRKGSTLQSYLEKTNNVEYFTNIAQPATISYDSFSANIDGDDTHLVSVASNDWPNLFAMITTRAAANQ